MTREQPNKNPAASIRATHDSQPTCGTAGLGSHGEDRIPRLWEEVSSLAADALPPARPSSDGMRVLPNTVAD
jgi:hypothetical protein